MARIAGIDLPRDKRIVIGLTYIYGIGNTTAKKVLAEAGVSEDVPLQHKKPLTVLLLKTGAVVAVRHKTSFHHQLVRLKPWAKLSLH